MSYFLEGKIFQAIKNSHTRENTLMNAQSNMERENLSYMESPSVKEKTLTKGTILRTGEREMINHAKTLKPVSINTCPKMLSFQETGLLSFQRCLLCINLINFETLLDTQICENNYVISNTFEIYYINNAFTGPAFLLIFSTKRSFLVENYLIQDNY